MPKKFDRRQIEALATGALLTALVIILQSVGAVIRFGPFSVSLVLLPIVIGAAVCSPKIAAWLGFVFGVVVLMNDAAAFLAISVPGTVITVLLKGALCGLGAGVTYKLLSRNKNKYLAVGAAAVVCPLINTGIFLLGCYLFFFETIREWGLAAGFENATEYLIFGMVGVNFLVEIIANIILCPVAVRIINAVKKR